MEETAAHQEDFNQISCLVSNVILQFSTLVAQIDFFSLFFFLKKILLPNNSNSFGII